MVYVEAGSNTNVLLAVEECLRHVGITVVVGEVSRYSTAASKRLQLAAEASGVTAFVFRRACKPEVLAQGTAAVTRWRIAAHPSAPLGIPSLGRPHWHVALERVRGGTPYSWIVDGADAQGCIALPAALVDRPAAAEDRQVAA
nr:hypothetical protein [Sphingobium sp. SCG-1]